MFPYTGLRKLDPTFSVQVGCVVGETLRKGPNYTADAAIFKTVAEESEAAHCEGVEAESEAEDSEEDDTKESIEQVAILIQVNAPPVKGVDK